MNSDQIIDSNNDFVVGELQERICDIVRKINSINALIKINTMVQFWYRNENKGEK